MTFSGLTLLWLAAALAALVLEVITVAFFALFVMIGALAAALAASLGASIPVQVVVFAVASGAGLLALRPPLMAYMRRRHAPELLSGAQSMIGQSAPVIEE